MVAPICWQAEAPPSSRCGYAGQGSCGAPPGVWRSGTGRGRKGSVAATATGTTAAGAAVAPTSWAVEAAAPTVAAGTAPADRPATAGRVALTEVGERAQALHADVIRIDVDRITRVTRVTGVRGRDSGNGKVLAGF